MLAMESLLGFRIPLASEHSQVGSSKTLGLQGAQQELERQSVVDLGLQHRVLSSLICPCSSESLHRTQRGTEQQEGPVCPRAQDLLCLSSTEMQSK